MTTTESGRAEPPGPTGGPPPARSNGGAAPSGRRRRDAREPASFTRASAPRRQRSGLTLLGIPVVTIVAIELIGVCVLVAVSKHAVAGAIAIAIAVLIAVGALLRRRSIRIGTWLVLRIGYLFRHRQTVVSATGYGTGPAADAVDDIDVAPELDAFFPGMTVWESRTHDGDRMGVVQWFGTCAATLRIGAPGGILRPRSTTENVPLPAIMAALEGRDLGLDAVQVTTQTIVGEQDPTLTPLLGAATAELAGGRPRVRNRSGYVTVRIDPAVAAPAVMARGGGNIGIARVLSAALSRIRAAVREAGLAAEVLDAGDASRAIAQSLYHQATPYDPVIRWLESVRHVASARMAHRSFVVTDVRRPALSEVPIGNVFGYTVGVQCRPAVGGGWATRSVVRVTCRSPESLNRASRELRSAARRAGITLQPLDAAQQLGLRATVPIGGV